MEENKVLTREEKLENPLIKYKNLIIIFFLFIVASVTILLNSEIFVISYQKIKAIPVIYVIIIIGMVLFLWISDAFLLHYPLNNPKLRFLDSLVVNFAGSFFSAITPYATGSQPSRLFYLHKKGVSVDKSIGGVLIKAFSYQCVIIILGLLSLIGGRNIILKMDNYRIVLTLGFLYNIALFVVSFIIAHSKKVTNWLIQLVKSIGSKQNKDKILTVDKKVIIEAIQNFYSNMRGFLKNKKMIFVMMSTYTIRQIVYNTIPIIILYSLGFPVTEYLVELISLSALMNIVITIVPTPGGVVAAEGAFILLFGLIYFNSDNELYAVMLMWRFFTHYLLIIFGFFAVLYLTIINSKNNKKRGMLIGSNNS